VRADALGPGDDAVGRPLAVLAMRPGAVLVGNRRGPLGPVAAWMTGDTRSAVQHLHDARTVEATKSPSLCVRVASAYVKLLAPSTATKSSTSVTSPVAGSTMRGLRPE